jgi:UDP-3-O-[3-hydroxymyristoyl] glucosamine N-acyltransferase
LSTGLRLGDIAEQIEAKLRGHPDARIMRLATLSGAGSDDISFLANPGYIHDLAQSRAGAVILAEQHADRFSGNCLISEQPYVSWARVASLLHPAPRSTPGVHASAVVDPSSTIANSAQVGAQVSIGADCRIGDHVIIGPGCVIDDGVEIGANAHLVARVYLGRNTRLGERILIHPGAVIGADGFGLALDRDHWIKVPQVGAVRIGDDCEIGANTTIDRGAIEDTVLEEDVRLDNQVQVAHNVRIGAHTAIAGCVGIAGSTTIGRYCMIAGASGIGGHLQICDKVVITAMSTVLESIDQPGHYGSGIPSRPHVAWKRILVRLGQLDDWAKRLARLEKNKQKPE